jgi:cell division protein FtsN
MRTNGNNPKDMSYKDYQQKMIRNKKQTMMTFASVFLILLIALLGIMKMMSPDVDISLGDNAQQNIEEETSSDGIDSRLRRLQEEDAMASNSNEVTSEEAGLVKIPQREDNSINALHDTNPVDTNINGVNSASGSANNPHPIDSNAAPTSIQHQQVTVQPVQTPAVPQPKTYRVYVGMYATKAQAEVARGILQDAGLGLTPNIKQAAGGYTLQVGAYSQKESAQNLSNRLLINNYPARVVAE